MKRSSIATPRRSSPAPRPDASKQEMTFMPSAADLAKRLNDAAGLPSMNVPDFVALLRDTFRHAGLSEADASIAADVAAHGTLHGSDAHGAVQMPLYVAGLMDGTIKSSPDIKLTGTLPCCKVMDADHALGLVAGQKAMDAAIAMAKAFGMGAVAVRKSSHNGTAGYFSERAAEHGLIGMAFTNAMPAIAPTGSTEALLGTNPIGAAFRSSARQVVPGGGSATGAVVVPIMTPSGCAGVLAVEYSSGLEQDQALQALATILAAQLTLLVDAEPDARIAIA